MQQAAAGFGELGVKKGDVIAQFSDNSSRWLIADQACRACMHIACSLAGVDYEQCAMHESAAADKDGKACSGHITIVAHLHESSASGMGLA